MYTRLICISLLIFAHLLMGFKCNYILFVFQTNAFTWIDFDTICSSQDLTWVKGRKWIFSFKGRGKKGTPTVVRFLFANISKKCCLLAHVSKEKLCIKIQTIVYDSSRVMTKQTFVSSLYNNGTKNKKSQIKTTLLVYLKFNYILIVVILPIVSPGTKSGGQNIACTFLRC